MNKKALIRLVMGIAIFLCHPLSVNAQEVDSAAAPQVVLQEVTDPAILAAFDDTATSATNRNTTDYLKDLPIISDTSISDKGRPVTDPKILAQLNAPDTPKKEIQSPVPPADDHTYLLLAEITGIAIGGIVALVILVKVIKRISKVKVSVENKRKLALFFLLLTVFIHVLFVLNKTYNGLSREQCRYVTADTDIRYFGYFHTWAANIFYFIYFVYATVLALNKWDLFFAPPKNNQVENR